MDKLSLRKRLSLLTGYTRDSGRWRRYALAWAVVLLLGFSLVLTAASLYFAGMGRGIAAVWSYFGDARIFLLNLLPVLLFCLVFWVLTGRVGWACFLTGVPILLLSVGNALKMRLRDDPVHMSDMLVLTEAGNITSAGYDLTLDSTQWFVVIMTLLAALCCALLCRTKLTPWRRGGARLRAAALIAAVLLGAAAMKGLYLNDTIYNSIQNYELFNRWSALEEFQSRGFLYPFLHSTNELFPDPPEGYEEDAAAEALAQYVSQDIPQEEQVDLLFLQLEAFSDFSDALPDAARAAYADFYALAEQSVHGTLLTNVFAGGTVDSERSVMTGYTELPSLRTPTESYVWYLREQGYHTQGSHPYYRWFYNRYNVNDYLGFEEYRFREGYYEDLLELYPSMIRSDEVLLSTVLAQYRETSAAGSPVLDFSITYQNHGPYESASFRGEDYIGEGRYSEATRCILNNYLDGIADTGAQLLALTQELNAEERPVILVAYGDHMPWMGDGNSVYAELGLNIDTSTQEGYLRYYGTPYLIWANDAAKALLGDAFVGAGETVGVSFLMRTLFDRCGWEGSALMQAQRALLGGFSMVSSTGAYLYDGAVTRTLPDEAAARLNAYRRIEFYVRQKGK